MTRKEKILITGGAGFIGSNVADRYIEAGYEVVIVDNLSTGDKKNLPEKATFHKIDICDREKLEAVFKEEKPAYVNHHAAQIDVRTSLDKPYYDAEVNVIGTINLLELARKYNVRKLIYAATGGALYGECSDKLANEKTPVNPLSHYGVSKFTAELYIKLYASLYERNYTILRYANVYGPRQNPKGEAGVVAIFTHDLLENKMPTIFGDGSQARDFIYVGDVAQANLEALKQGDRETINVGTGHITTVNQLFDILRKVTSFHGDPKYGPARLGEIIKSGFDSSFAKQALGWSAKTSLEEGLRKTVAWQRGIH